MKARSRKWAKHSLKGAGSRLRARQDPATTPPASTTHFYANPVEMHPSHLVDSGRMVADMRRNKPPFERRLKCDILFARFDRRLLPIGRCEPPLVSRHVIDAQHGCVRSKRTVILICPVARPARRTGTGAGKASR